MMPQEVFLLSDVPGDVALAVAVAFGATFGASIVALWKQHLIDVARGQANVERMAETSHATADAMAELTRAFQETTHAAKRPA